MKWYKLSDLSAEVAAFRQCISGRLDLVHFLDGEHSGQFLPGLLQLSRSKVRTVASFHQPPQVLDTILDPALITRFDHIVLMSPTQRRYFEGRVPDDRVSVILHGVDTEFFHPHKAERPSGALRCITAGHWLRDWRTFRSVAERQPSTEFHVVTSRDTGAEDLPNVRRHQAIDDATLALLYRTADILFLPLHDATANNALLEGMASGLPVVTTELESARAYLRGDEGILTPSADPDSALAAIQQLERDPDLRRRMGEAARARAESLSWPRVASRYEALFTDLVRQPRSKSA